MKTKIILTLSALTLVVWFWVYLIIQNNLICFDKICENTKRINSLNFQVPKLEKEISKKTKAKEDLEKEISDLENQVKNITDEKISLFKENNEITWWWKRWMGDAPVPTTKQEFVPPEEAKNFSTESLSWNVVGYEVIEPQKKN